MSDDSKKFECENGICEYCIHKHSCAASDSIMTSETHMFDENLLDMILVAPDQLGPPGSYFMPIYEQDTGGLLKVLVINTRSKFEH